MLTDIRINTDNLDLSGSEYPFNYPSVWLLILHIYFFM